MKSARDAVRAVGERQAMTTPVPIRILAQVTGGKTKGSASLRLQSPSDQCPPAACHRRPGTATPLRGDSAPTRFKHDLSDQDLAPGRSHDGLGPRGEVPDLDRDVRHRAFFPPLVRIDDGSRSPVSEP